MRLWTRGSVRLGVNAGLAKFIFLRAGVAFLWRCFELCFLRSRTPFRLASHSRASTIGRPRAMSTILGLFLGQCHEWKLPSAPRPFLAHRIFLHLRSIQNAAVAAALAVCRRTLFFPVFWIVLLVGTTGSIPAWLPWASGCRTGSAPMTA